MIKSYSVKTAIVIAEELYFILMEILLPKQ